MERRGQARALPRTRFRAPTGRALAGAALITIAAGGVLVAHRSAEQPPTTRYLVATHDLPAGTRLSAGDLGSVAIDLPGDVTAVAESDADRIIGRMTRHRLSELDLVRPGDVHDADRTGDPDAVDLALELEPARALDGALDDGDVVDVLATAAGEAGTTTVLADGATVLSVNDGGAEGGIGSSGVVRVRLRLPDRATATQVADAAVRSDLTLVRPSRPRSTDG